MNILWIFTSTLLYCVLQWLVVFLYMAWKNRSENHK